jgi:hypothetical protein
MADHLPAFNVVEENELNHSLASALRYGLTSSLFSVRGIENLLSVPANSRRARGPKPRRRSIISGAGSATEEGRRPAKPRPAATCDAARSAGNW